MDVLRSVKNSIYSTLSSTFKTGTLLGTAYNVYDETDLRNGNSTIPVRPYVYLLDYGVLYEPSYLPVILIQTEMRSVGWEMGTDDCYRVFVALHLIGSNRGERDDLESAIQRRIKGFTLYNHMVSTPVLVGTVGLEPDADGNYWTELSNQIPLNLAREGTLENWVPITTSILVVNPGSWPTS